MSMLAHPTPGYVTCKVEILALMPEGLNPADAGALPLVLQTGAQLIEKGIAPKSGQRLLVTGALGSVGRTAVHVAKQHGAYVIAAVRASQRAAAAELGADQIVAIDDPQEIAGLKELDAVADTIGRDVIDRLLPRIKKSGILATVVGKPNSADGYDVQVHEVWSEPDAKRLQQLAADAVSGALAFPL